MNDRLRRLAASGAIRRFTADADPAAHGLGVPAFVGVALARHRLPPGFALWVSRGSGAVLILFGPWALAGAARPLAVTPP